MQNPTASIAIPTRGRPEYLEVALTSVMPQAAAAGAEVLVVSDGHDPATEEVATRHGARVLSVPSGSGANAARNAAIDATSGELIVFIDDDVEAPYGWLDALLAAARERPGYGVLGGPIHACLEGGGPRACGRERAPITTLELGSEDRDAALVWSANMAVRRGAFELAGRFDEGIAGRGEEEEWERRFVQAGGRIRYVAGAGLDHRRSAVDARLWALARANFALGRTARRYDVRKGLAPSLGGELRTLLGCGWHILRRRCAIGAVMMAQSAGRIREAVAFSAPTTGSARDDFLSGESGHVAGIRHTTRALATDALAAAVAAARRQHQRLDQAARALPNRRVLVLAVERLDVPNLLAAARAELLRSRHQVSIEVGVVGDRGKFENLNLLLESHPAERADWLLLLDDDVALPAGFLDEFLFLAERFELRIAQPAHRSRSHAAWRVTRRRIGSVARETGFVEIGPVTALHRSTFDALLPFPALRAGWGLDLHWAAIAREHGWKIGVIDATPIGHSLRPVAASYTHRAAIDEAREFLAGRQYVPAAEAQRTLAEYRSWK